MGVIRKKQKRSRVRVWFRVKGVLATSSLRHTAGKGLKPSYWHATLKDPCPYCGGKSDSKEHLTPKSAGGKDSWENVVRACAACNRKRGSKPLLLFLLELHKMRKMLVVVLALSVCATGVQTQTPPVKNPSGVTFVSPDHDTITNYEVDIVIASTGSVLTTIVAGKGTLSNGVVTLPLNVQPIVFGTYTLRVRAVASPTLKSDDSDASDPWERVPGAPSKLILN